MATTDSEENFEPDEPKRIEPSEEALAGAKKMIEALYAKKQASLTGEESMAIATRLKQSMAEGVFSLGKDYTDGRKYGIVEELVIATNAKGGKSSIL